MKLILLTLCTLLLTMGCTDKSKSPPVSQAPSTNAATADTVYLNGTIITVNDDQPSAQAVAIKNGKIIYVGDDSGAKRFVGPATEQVDLDNRTMVPGFVDAHGHVVSAGIQAASANLLPLPDGPVNSFAELLDTLKAWQTSDTGKKFIANTGWILGFGFDDSQLSEQV